MQKNLEAELLRLTQAAPSLARSLALGNTYLLAGDPLAAAKAFEEGRTLAGSLTPELARGLGYSFLRQHRAEDALPCLKQALQRDPKSFDLNIVYCRVLNRTGRFKEALKITERMVREFPNHPEVMFLHGEQLARAGRIKDGSNVTRRTLEGIRPLAKHHTERLMAIWIADGEYARVARTLREMLETNFDNAQWQNLLNHCLSHLSFDPEEALRAEASPRPDALTYLHAAIFLERKGQISEAISAIQKCRELRPESLIAKGLHARLLLRSGDALEAAGLQKDIWSAANEVLAGQQKAELQRPQRLPWGLEVRRPLLPVLYLPVEIAGRELHTRLLLAQAAVRVGFIPVILSYSVFRFDPTLLPPGVILYKSYNALDRGLVQICREAGHIFTAIDEEAFGWTGNAFSMMRAADPRNLPFCSAIFAPGDVYAETMRAASGEHAEKIFSTGNPRTDFYRPELRQRIVKEAASLKVDESPAILVCTNFGGWNSAANFYPTVCYTALELSGADAEGPQGRWALDIYQDAAETECRNTPAILEALAALAAHFPQFRIILRPHPSEDPQTWRQMTQQFANVSVDATGSLAARMLAADAVVHLPGCGTGLEAYLLDRPAISFDTVKDLKYPRLGLSAQSSIVAQTAAELCRAVERACNEPASVLEDMRRQADAVHRHVRFGHERASDQIINVLQRLFAERTAGEPATGTPQIRRQISDSLALLHESQKFSAHADVKREAAKKLTVTRDEVLALLRDLDMAPEKNRLRVDAPAQSIFVVTEDTAGR